MRYLTVASQCNSRSAGDKGDDVYGKDSSYIQKEEKIHPFLAPVIKTYLKLESFGKRFLDIGCGPGQWSRMAALHGAKSVDGFDIQEKMVEAAKQATSKFSTVNIKLGDVRDMPYDNDVFDIAFSIYVTSTLPKKALAMHYQELYRVLAPGGKAIVVNLTNSAYQQLYVSDGADKSAVQKSISQVLTSLPKHPTLQQINHHFQPFDAAIESLCFALDKDGSLFRIDNIEDLTIGEDVWFKARSLTFPDYFYNEQYLVDLTVASGLHVDKVENYCTEEIRLAHNTKHPDAFASKSRVENPLSVMSYLTKPL